MPNSQIKQVPIGSLRPNPANVRTHSKKQIGQIENSIHQFGWTALPIVDENYVILAGHGRFEAARRLGMHDVTVNVISGLSDIQKRLLSVADNKIASNGGWDRKKLAVELGDLSPLLPELNLDLSITGFETAEIDGLLGDFVDPENDPADEVPNLRKEAISKRGNLWELGGHRLLCGDATSAHDLRRLMGNQRASMVITDPPYNLPARRIQGRGSIKHGAFLQGSGEFSPAQHGKFLRSGLSLAAQYSLNGAIHFVFMDWRHLRQLLAAGSTVYSEHKNIIVWAKTNAGQGSFYRSQHELICVFKSGDAPHINNFELGQHGRHRSNVWTYPGTNTFRPDRMVDLSMHPTVKRVALIADAMRDCSRRGDIVLDPFMGSGTTIMAAERVGRRGYGLELDPHYVDAAVRRWQAYTRRDATLTSTGETFDEISVARTKAGVDNA
jgi:DNA modification methylase